MKKWSLRVFKLTLFIGFSVFFVACYNMRPSNGGGETKFEPPRVIDPADIAVPAGYRIEAIAEGLTFPTGITFDEKGTPYVTESGYSYGEVWTTPRLLRIEPNGKLTPIAKGGRNGPWNGVFFHNGAFFVAEGGELEGGRILKITLDGKTSVILKDLPSMGDHHTNGPIVGQDGWIYFGQGTATNSGVVGEDNAEFGWLKRYPRFHDIPGQDITLTGENFETRDPFDPNSKMPVITGAFSPFGTPTRFGQVIKGKLPCTGSIMRVTPSGDKLELVAWGFRNPFGLAFDPNGKLYVTENGYDDRGSRPVWGTADVLWAVTPKTWYGWPDFSAGRPLTEADDFKPPGKHTPTFLLASFPNTPPKPVVRFGVHASANGLDFSRSSKFGHVGQAFVAIFGDQAPVTGKVLHPVGFKVVRVDVQKGTIEDFAINQGRKNSPGSKTKHGGLERPLAVRFDPSGQSLYVVDFGVMTMTEKKAVPYERTGVIWRIVREANL